MKTNTKGPLIGKAYAEIKKDSGKSTAKQPMDKCIWNIDKLATRYGASLEKHRQC